MDRRRLPAPPEGPVVFVQPAAVLAVIGRISGDEPPEALGVVHLPKMRELMDQHIVQDRPRGEDEPPIEIQISLGGTAARCGFLS